MHLATSGLPVKNIDQCTCWENIQYAFLCMSDENFDLFLLTDEEVKQSKIKTQKEKQSNKKEELTKVLTNDNYLNEIEKSFEKGNIDDVMKLLDNM